jgi:type IV pilus assembly protein PilC
VEFTCRVATAGGEITESVYVADNEARLRRELEDRGLFVLDVRRRGALAWTSLQLPQRQRIPSRMFLVFNQELATLLKAGMPLVQSLDILRQRVEHPLFKTVLDDVYERVKAGSSLSESFEAHGELFSGVYTASLMAGEKSGGLEQVLRRFVAYVKIVSEVRRKTVSALMYPAILITLAFAVVSYLVLRVVPQFEDFYANFGAELPWTTKLILNGSAFVRSYFLVLFLAVGGTVALFLWWVRHPGQKARLHRLILTVPWAGSLARRFATSQLSRTLATLLGGGIPLVSALEIGGRSIGNRYIAAELVTVARRVREGESLAAAMTARGMFPDVALKMVEVGESTGALQEMLNSIADFYDEEIETNLARFVTMVEPILLVAIGLVIAGLLLALYMPLFQLSTVVS